MRRRFEITGMKNIRNDSIWKRSANARIAKSTLDNEIQNEIMPSMKNLKKRNTLMSSLQQVWKTARRNWNLLTNTLPQNIFNICRKALILSQQQQKLGTLEDSWLTHPNPFSLQLHFCNQRWWIQVESRLNFQDHFVLSYHHKRVCVCCRWGT